MVPAGCLAVAVGHACVEILSAEYRAIDRILYCLIPLVPGGQVIDRSIYRLEESACCAG